MKRKNQCIYRTCLTQDRPLVYVLRGENGDMLIDTGHKVSAKPIDRWIRRNGYDIKWIFLTHGHSDHSFNALFFQKKYGAKVLLHEKDLALYRGEECPLLLPSAPENQIVANKANQIAGKTNVPLCSVDYLITDADTGLLRSLGFDADIVMLPGHTAGSVGILQGRTLYCGDACAAKRGDYYTCLFGYDVDEIYRTEKIIFELNPLIIAPGHGKFIVNERAFPSK